MDGTGGKGLAAADALEGRLFVQQATTVARVRDR